MIPLNIKLFSTSGVSKTITKTIKDSYNNSYTVTISISETLADDYITTNKSLLSGSVVVSNTGSGGAYTSSKSMSATLTFKHTDGSGDTLLTKTGSCKFDFQGNATKTATPLSFSGSEISHDSDGSLTLYIAIQLKITETSLKQTQNWTDSITLTSIPRASTLNSFTSTNTTATYGYTKKNSGFYDVITFTSNGKTLGTVNNPKSSAGTYSGLTKSYDMSKVLEASTSAGSKTITVTCTIQTYSDSSKTTLIGSSSSSTSISLGTSTLSSVTLSIANNGTATIVPTISKWNAGTYDVLTISGNNFSQIFNNVSSGTTYTLNNTNLFNAMGTSTSLTLNCVLTTYSAQNGTSLGTSAQNNKTISLPAYNINASVNSYSDLNNSSQPGSMGYALSTFKPNTQTMIRYLSSPKITFKVSSSTGYLYGRNISTSGAATKTGLSHNSTFDVTIGTNPNSSYSITATDGRKSGSVTQSFTVVPYFIPSVTCSIVRPLPTSTTADVTIKATYYNDSGSLLTNKKTINNSNGSLTLQYTEEGGSQVTKTYSNFTISNSTSGTSTTMTATLQLTGLDPSKSIAYSVVFKDLITYQAKSNGTIPNGQPALSVYRKSGKNYVKANGDLIVRGNTTVDSIKGKNMFDKNTIVAGSITGVSTNSRLSSRQALWLEVGTYTCSTNLSSTYNWCVQVQSVGVPPLASAPTFIIDSPWLSSTSYTFTINTAGYFSLVFRKSDNGNLFVSDIIGFNYQLEAGSTATNFAPYQELDVNNLANKELVVGSIRSKNMFDYTITPTKTEGTNVNIINNGIKIIAKTSSTYLQAIYKILDIDDYLGKIITLSCNINISSGNPRIVIGTCDSSGNNRAILSDKSISSSGTYSVTATLPTSTTSTTKYMYIGLNISRNTAIAVGNYSEFTNILLEEGSTATNYVPYQNLNGIETYSTNEQVIGTWIDGKPIYRKVISYTNSSTIGASNQITDVDISHEISNIGTAISVKGLIGGVYDLPYLDGDGTKITKATWVSRFNTTIIRLRILNDTWSSRTSYFILEYTKTTD